MRGGGVIYLALRGYFGTRVIAGVGDLLRSTVDKDVIGYRLSVSVPSTSSRRVSSLTLSYPSLRLQW